MCRLIFGGLLLTVVGCGGKGSEDGSGDDTADSTAGQGSGESCVMDDEVCASYSSAWTATQAAEHCAASGGTPGACPSGAEGTCVLDSGLTYHLYVMPSMEAESYCDWLNGEWVDGD